MNKKRRNELVFLHYKRRIQKLAVGTDIYFTRDGEKIFNPKTIDLLNDRCQYVYKNTSTPCSCWLCAYNKYNRAKEKAKFLKEQNREANEDSLQCPDI